MEFGVGELRCVSCFAFVEFRELACASYVACVALRELICVRCVAGVFRCGCRVVWVDLCALHA